MSTKQLDGQALSSLGIRYYAFGVLRVQSSRRTYGYYFKTEGLTEAQRTELKARFDRIEFKSSRPAHAPEIKSTLIIQLSRAEMARQKQSIP